MDDARAIPILVHDVGHNVACIFYDVSGLINSDRIDEYTGANEQ